MAVALQLGKDYLARYQLQEDARELHIDRHLAGQTRVVEHPERVGQAGEFSGNIRVLRVIGRGALRVVTDRLREGGGDREDPDRVGVELDAVVERAGAVEAPPGGGGKQPGGARWGRVPQAVC